MLRELVNKLSGTHLTLLVMTAILAPSALVAAVTFQPVAIVDPNSGIKSYVDAGRRLYVYDPIAGYRNFPANFVNISGGCIAGAIYQPPSGKALVVTSVNFFHYNGTAGGDNFEYIKDGDNYVAGSEDGNAVGNLSVDLGNGYVLKNGHSLQTLCSTAGHWLVAITGYLVPAGSAPLVGTSEAAGQSVQFGPALTKVGTRP